MELIHPMEVQRMKNMPAREHRSLINNLKELYPAAVSDVVGLEHCLHVIYNNQEIYLLLEKVVRERDAAILKKKERRTKNRDIATEVSSSETVEDVDQFEVADAREMDIEAVITGKPSIQDLLDVIRQAGLEEALPQAMKIIELAAVTPLSSVHCERVFSRMKRVVSASRSGMLQKRKETLLFLQVEQTTLRWLSEQPNVKTNVIATFKSFNQTRMSRFSRK